MLLNELWRGTISARAQAALVEQAWGQAGLEAREALQALTRAQNVLVIHAQPVPTVVETPVFLEAKSILPIVPAMNLSTFREVEEWFDGEDVELVVRNEAGIAIAQLTDNTTDDLAPDISYRMIVWQTLTFKGWEVMMERETGTVALTDDEADDTQPETDGRFVVWLKTIDGVAEVWLYDRTSGFLEAVSSLEHTARGVPVHDGVVEWEQWNDDSWEPARFLTSELMKKFRE